MANTARNAVSLRDREAAYAGARVPPDAPFRASFSLSPLRAARLVSCPPFSPSRKAGPKVAAILSIVESCRRMRVPLKDYLLDVLPGLDRRKLSEVALLTPSRWAAARI
jgi:hypothetical protein